MRAEIVSEALILGGVREVLQPMVDKAGSLSLRPRAQHRQRHATRLTAALPLKPTLIETYGGYLAAHKVDKPDIWAARAVDLPAGRGYAPVTSRSGTAASTRRCSPAGWSRRRQAGGDRLRQVRRSVAGRRCIRSRPTCAPGCRR